MHRTATPARTANTSYRQGSYEIPEGGTFAYKPKNGQSATVTVAHEGMTYTYTVNVLAPDGSTFAQHTYTVTYITAATHKAQLHRHPRGRYGRQGLRPGQTRVQRIRER